MYIVLFSLKLRLLIDHLVNVDEACLIKRSAINTYEVTEV
jgi:hypothetical protein